MTTALIHSEDWRRFDYGAQHPLRMERLGLTWRASLTRNQPYLRFIGAALVFFVVQAVFSLWHGFNTMTARLATSRGQRFPNDG